MPPDRERQRNEHGQYADRIPPSRVLEVFDAREDRARPLTAGDITDALDCSRRTAHNKLNELVDRDELATRKVGARGRVWWVPLLEDQAVDTQGATAGAESAGASPPTDTTPEPPDAVSGDPVREDVDRETYLSDLVADLDLPGSGSRLEARREAVRQMLAHLAEHGRADKSELLAVVDVDAAEYGSPRSLWSNLIQGTRVFQDLEDVETPGEGPGNYRWVGPAL